MLLPQQGGQGVPAAREGLSVTERGGRGGRRSRTLPAPHSGPVACAKLSDCSTLGFYVKLKTPQRQTGHTQGLRPTPDGRPPPSSWILRRAPRPGPSPTAAHGPAAQGAQGAAAVSGQAPRAEKARGHQSTRHSIEVLGWGAAAGLLGPPLPPLPQWWGESSPSCVMAGKRLYLWSLSLTATFNPSLRLLLRPDSPVKSGVLPRPRPAG